LCWCIKADVAAAVDVAAQADSVLWNTPRSRSPALQFQLLSGQVALWLLSSVAVSVSVSVTVALAVFSVSSAFSVVVFVVVVVNRRRLRQSYKATKAII